MNKTNYLAISEMYAADLLALAEGILAGKVKMIPENRSFYESWARRYLDWREKHYRGRAIAPNEETPKAKGQNRAKGEAKAIDLPAEDPNQGRLF